MNMKHKTRQLFKKAEFFGKMQLDNRHRADTCELSETSCSLERKLSDVQKLWQEKQRQLKKNMIFATINVVKNWDLNQVGEV